MEFVVEVKTFCWTLAEGRLGEMERTVGLQLPEGDGDIESVYV